MPIDNITIKTFEWDKSNIDKNWLKHKVHFKEAEEVFFNQPLIVLDDLAHSDREKRYQCLGHTDAGRLLFISFTVRSSRIRVISARPQSKHERNEYEKR